MSHFIELPDGNKVQVNMIDSVKRGKNGNAIIVLISGKSIITSISFNRVKAMVDEARQSGQVVKSVPVMDVSPFKTEAAF